MAERFGPTNEMRSFYLSVQLRAERRAVFAPSRILARDGRQLVHPV